MCDAVQRFGEQLAAAGAFLQEAWAVQAAQLQASVSKGACDARVRVADHHGCQNCANIRPYSALCSCSLLSVKEYIDTRVALQVDECREAAGNLQTQLQQGVFVDASAAAPDAVAELQNLLDNISELQVACRFANGAKQAVAS
jgi:hypothetical protein